MNLINFMWFFKKRDDKPKWDTLHNTLKNSFNNIKKDVSHVHLKIDNHHLKHKDELNILSKRVARLESLMEQLILDYSKTKNEQQMQKYYQEEIDNTKQDENVTNLTNLQKSILANLSILRNESSKEWISMKDLAQELYPNKKYSKIKSLLSAYTDLLVDLKLVKKEKKGKETYLSLTNKSDKVTKRVKQKSEIKE